MISIIIPVYNVSSCLPRCLDSIIAQSNKNWEAILIDDGSTDKSGVICDEYARNDIRFRVFHKENGGVSSARNLGLSKITGDFVAFVDADDYVDSNYLDLPEGVDGETLIIKGFDSIQEETGVIISHKEYKDVIFTSVNDIHRYVVNHLNFALWDKLLPAYAVKPSKFLENVKIGEDMLFFLSTLHRYRRIQFFSKGHYHYMHRENSVMADMRSSIDKTLYVAQQNIPLILTTLADQGLKDVGVSIALYRYVCRAVYSNRDKCSEKLKKEVIHLFREVTFRSLLYLEKKEIIKSILKAIIIRIKWSNV